MQSRTPYARLVVSSSWCYQRSIGTKMQLRMNLRSDSYSPTCTSYFSLLHTNSIVSFHVRANLLPHGSSSSTCPTLPPTLMSEDEYSTETTLKGHTSSTVTLEFSPDGKFLASGADNGVVLIFSTSSWVPLGHFVDTSPVSVMTWYIGKRYLLLCGHRSGDLHFLTFTGSVVSSSLSVLPHLLTATMQENVVVWTSTFDGPIHSLSIFPTSHCVAIAYGNEVVLTEVLFNPNRLNDKRKHLPKLPSASQFSTKLPEPIATSLHFLGDKNQLLVTYTAHGIV